MRPTLPYGFRNRGGSDSGAGRQQDRAGTVEARDAKGVSLPCAQREVDGENHERIVRGFVTGSDQLKCAEVATLLVVGDSGIERSRSLDAAK